MSTVNPNLTKYNTALFEYYKLKNITLNYKFKLGKGHIKIINNFKKVYMQDLIKNNKDLPTPKQCNFKLSGEQVREKMKKILGKNLMLRIMLLA